MKMLAQIVDVKLTTTANGVIGKVITNDGKIIFSKNEQTPLVEALSVGQTAEFDVHEEKNPKGTFLVLDDVKVIESQETAPETVEPEPAKTEEIVHKALILKIAEGETHGKKYWKVETDFFGTVYCPEENLMTFEEGDTCELACKVTEKGSVVIMGVKVVKAAEKKQNASAQPAQPTNPPVPPVPPKTANAEQQTAQQKVEQEKRVDPPKVPPVSAQATAKTPPVPSQVTGNNGEQKKPDKKPAPAPKPEAAESNSSTPAEPTVSEKEDKNNPNLQIYRKVRSVPKEAMKAFNNGRFSGTDISPMWRIKKLTQLFGPCGIGWYVTVDKQWLEVTNEAVGEVKAFVNLSLYVKNEGEWSKPIFGNGGNSFQAVNRNGQVVVDDECFKKAFTDAFGSACKLLGIGADVYWSADPDSKYS